MQHDGRKIEELAMFADKNKDKSVLEIVKLWKQKTMNSAQSVTEESIMLGLIKDIKQNAIPFREH